MLTYFELLSGNDIPFPEAQINVHQPRLKDLGHMSEVDFFTGCEWLNFNKEKLLKNEDKSVPDARTNFEIFMSIMNDRETQTFQTYRLNVFILLTLIFPSYQISLGKDKLILIDEQEQEHAITATNFDKFKEIISAIFCLNKKNKNSDIPDEYNPANDAAAAIAAKFKKGREKVAEIKGEKNKPSSVLGKRMSILSVGMKIALPQILEYTIYQLFDSFDRYELKAANDALFEAQLAGAKDLDKIDSWLQDMQP